jgi:predicted nuclease of predicted toxin-antitoxin system
VKLLLDQNLSYRLLKDIDAAFPGSRHVADFNLTAEDDEKIWRFTLDQGFVIVSKDSDFFHRALLRGHPPKVIHLKIGNCTTNYIRDLLVNNATLIAEFVSDPVESLLILE